MSDEFLILNAAPARAWLRDPKEPWRKPTLRKTLYYIVDHRRAWAMYQAGVKTIRVRLHMLESPFFEELANKCDRLGIKIGDLMVRERQDRILHSGLKQCYMMDHFFNTPDGSIIAGLSFEKPVQANRWRSNGQPLALVSPVGSGGVYVSAVSLLGNLQACFNFSREWIAIGNYVVVYSSNCLRQAAIGL